MGLYLGTNGVGVTARVRSGLSSQGKHIAILIFLAMVAISFAIKYWQVTLPIAFVFCLYMAHRAKQRATSARQASESPASVSNRR